MTNEKQAVKPAEGGQEKRTLKSVGKGLIDGLSGSVMPAIPAIMAASIFKMIIAVCGPGMLGIMQEGTDLYTLCSFVGDAAFYFFPLLIGYTAANKLGVTPVLGIFLGAVMMHPTFSGMVGAEFTVFGIPCNVQNYANTILPVIMSVWVMSYVERFFKKYVPEVLQTMFVPVLTIAVMLPVTLCVLGPAGAFMGNFMCDAIMAFADLFGFFGIAILGAFWQFLVMTGMHQVAVAQMIMLIAENGFDPVLSPGGGAASMAVSGMCLGMFLALKDKEQKSLGFGYFMTAFVGGITEPGLYGVGMRYKKPFIGLIAGGFAGGLYAGIMGVKAYAFVPVASFLAMTSFAGGSVSNLVHGIISGVISIVVAAAVTFFLCRDMKIEEHK